MSRYDDERLDDILVAIEAIKEHLKRGDIHDGLIFDAVRMRLLEIGEAVKSMDSAVLAGENEVPWEGVVRMRDRLAHHYFDTSHAIVLATVEEDLPQLESAVRRIRGVGTEPD